MQEPNRHLIVMGIQGSGKGTQCAAILEQFEYHYFEAGRVIRDHISQNTLIGQKIAALVQHGGMVSDDLIDEIVADFLQTKTGYLLFDGFPRDIEQKHYLDKVLQERQTEYRVIFLDLAKEVALNRVQKRKICTNCFKIHLGPYDQMICSSCGGALESRADDVEETAVRQRMEDFMQKTAPVLAEYEREGRLYRIDAARPVEEVTHDIITYLKGDE